MDYAFNSVLLAITFFEGAAALILLVIYSLLATAIPQRFFRYWVAGWTFFLALQGTRIALLLAGASGNNLNLYPLALGMTICFLAVAFECTGLADRLKYLVFWGVVTCAGLIAVDLAGLPVLLRWGRSLAESGLLLGAGSLLWRSQSQHRGVGWKLLAGSLLLCGLHSLDRPLWQVQPFFLFRVAVHGVLVITAGIAMAVLALEADRARNQDLSERLRRLALITAAATQSFRVDKALDGILRHLVESLGASHGIVFLFNDSSEEAALDISASVGFSDAYRNQ
jgi:hypothetical protein